MTTSIKFRALTDEDHKLFFEALGEHGKDFQNIQQYMAQKGGQKSNNASNGGNNNNINNSNNSKNENKLFDAQERKELDKREDDRKREQIRNFYNKLYAKLSELIGKIDDRVEKVNQELYLLINYGEIWKRNGFKFNSKTKRLLEELVYHGTTTFRYEKKNVRLRTPTCKALKKINEIGVDEKVKVVTTKELPKDVIVEFHPATNRDWLRVQSLSQNPRVRARLSMQKRLTSILEYLENKWDVSQNKLNRTVDVWLKVSSNSFQNSESSTNNPPDTDPSNGQTNQQNYLHDHVQHESSNGNSIHRRIRLKPSNHHELKEVNITRVVPDNHLDLSLNAYIKRLESSLPKGGDQATNKNQQNQHDTKCDNFEFSSVTTTASRLPVSLTTPDCSILLERSCTSDQPSIAQVRKHLNILQSLTGTLEGCENSRTAYEDTQDRSLMNMLLNQNSRSVSFAPNEPNVSPDNEHVQMQSNSTILVNNDIAALYDEDAALPVSSSTQNETQNDNSPNNNNVQANLPSSDSQNSKSVDFQIPKDVTLGDYFKMTGAHNDNSPIGVGGDEAANDAFPLSLDRLDEESDHKDLDKESEEQYQDVRTKDNCNLANSQVKPQNHMIEIKKFADGWTMHDEPTLTLGELYLAFKCPEKIVLEYEFEQYTYEHGSNSQPVVDNPGENLSINQTESTKASSTKIIRENLSDRILIFKLLTAASLSLAQIERQKQEQQHKLLESQQSSCSKLKRRKGSGQGQTMTLHDIEATNQRVEEALKQLQPTRLSSFRRAR
jgi:hypothetical protein